MDADKFADKIERTIRADKKPAYKGTSIDITTKFFTDNKDIFTTMTHYTKGAAKIIPLKLLDDGYHGHQYNIRNYMLYALIFSDKSLDIVILPIRDLYNMNSVFTLIDNLSDDKLAEKTKNTNSALIRQLENDLFQKYSKGDFHYVVRIDLTKLNLSDFFALRMYLKNNIKNLSELTRCLVDIESNYLENYFVRLMDY